MKDYEIINVYCAHGDGGDEYRRGPVIGVFSTKASADQASKGKGWYGSDGGVDVVKAVRLSDGKVYIINNGPIDLDEHQKKLDQQLKASALSKLSPEEVRVLGI